MYSVKFMNDQEFETLPYRDMGSKVGVCDRNRGQIFVRQSGVPPLDTFNAIHEIEHMQDGDWGRHANHQDPEMKGVYYKGFMDVLLPIAAAVLLPGIGGALGPALGGVGQALAGAGSVINPALGGAMSSIGSGVGSALGIGGGAGGGFTGGAGGSVLGGSGASAMSAPATMGGAASAGAGAGAAGGATNVLQSGLGALGQMAGQTAQQTAQGIGQNALMGAFGPKQPKQSFSTDYFSSPTVIPSTTQMGAKANVLQPQKLTGGGIGGGISDTLKQSIQGYFGGQDPTRQIQAAGGFGGGNTPFQQGGVL